MKKILLCLLFFVRIQAAVAQDQKRHIVFRTIDKDSVILPLNEQYFLIEDSCAQIIRHSRLKMSERRFYGKFTDVSKANPHLIVSEGTYSDDGQKNGAFTTHYLNGNLQAKGNFLNNKYDGKWEIYFEDGKPELIFEVINGDSHVSDVWNADGKKVVDNGNGMYVDDIGGMYWKGKLVNGKPDGRWELFNSQDISNTAIATESFKKGIFKGGSTGAYEYTAESHIALVGTSKLSFVNAEKMVLSTVACNGTRSRHVIKGAQYKDGVDAFSNQINDAVSRYLFVNNAKTAATTTIEIEGEVAENGEIINLKNNKSLAVDVARDLTIRLKRLPPLQPATIDGKPVRQKFTISFFIADGKYQFTYRFLPITIGG